jgi:NADH-quinone oxidoreductase subunit L
MVWSIFFGKERRTQELLVTEPPFVMQAPILILATASLWIIVSWNPLVNSRWINPQLEHSWMITFVSMAWVALAIISAAISRRKNFSAAILINGFFIDKLYMGIIRLFVFRTARVSSTIDEKWIDGFIHASAYTQVILAHVIGWFDRAIIDGTVNGFASVARGVGSVTRSFQDGKIQLYIFWSVFTIIIFLIWKLL